MNFYQQLKNDIGGAFKRIVVGQFSDTLQQYLDCTINPYIKKKLSIQDVMNGQKQTDFDMDIINQKLGTNIVQNAYIKNIKMSNLQIMIDEIYIELNCAQQVKQSDVERIVQQAKQNEQKEKIRQNLRKSIFQQMENSTQQQIQEVQPKQKKVQQILKFINLVFGNTEIEIKNIQIKVIWSIVGQQRFIDLNISNIVTKLQEHPETSKQLIVASIDNFKMTSQQRLISQMKNVLSAQIYIDNKEKPKINIEMGLLQFIIDGFELNCLFELIQQIQKSRADYDRFYQELIQKERNLNTIKIIKVEEQQEQIVYQENYLEKSILLDIDNYDRGRYSQVDEIDQVLLKSMTMSVHGDFFGYGLSVLSQKDNLHAVFDGINIIISQENLYECGQKIFSDQRFNKYCGNHFVFNIDKVTCNQNFQNNNTDIQVLKISLYEIIQEINKFDKIKAMSENDEFYSISAGSQSFKDCKGENFSVARTILILGNMQKEKFIVVDKQKFFIQEQNLMPSKVSQAIHVKIKDDTIKVNISPINIILNFQLLNIFTYLASQLSDKNQQYQNEPIQPIVLSKTVQIDASFKFNFVPILLDLEYYQYNPDIQYKSYSLQSDKTLLRMKYIDEKFENQININIKSIQSENLIEIQNTSCDIVIRKMENLKQLEHTSSKVRISQLKHLKQTQNVFVNLNIPVIIVKQTQLQNILCDFITGKDNSSVYSYDSELFQSINLARQKSSNYSIVKPIKFVHLDVQVQTLLVETENAIRIEIKHIQFVQTYIQQLILIKSIEVLDKSFVMEQKYQNILVSNLDKNKYVVKGILDQFIKIQNLRIRLCNFQFLFMNYYYPIIKLLQNQKPNQDQQFPAEQSEPIQIKLKSILVDLIPSKFKTQSEQVRVQLFLSRLEYLNNTIKLNEISGYITKQIQEYDLLEIMTINKFLYLTELDLMVKENLQEKQINLLLKNLYIFNLSLQLYTQFNKCLQIITEQLTAQVWFLNLTSPNKQQQDKNTVEKQNQIRTKIQLQIDKIQLADPKNFIHINVHVLNIDIQQTNKIKLILQRLEILDNFPESRFRYILDQDTADAYFQQFDQSQQIRLDVDNYLEAEIKLDQDLIVINYNIFPTRLFLTGFFLEYLQNTLLKDPDQFDDFEIIEDNAERQIEESMQQQEQSELQQSNKQFTIIGNSLLFILNFDSKGIKSDKFLKRFIKLGNLNDFYLQSKVIDIKNCKQDELSKQIIQLFGSPLDLTFEAYNSLEILTCVSALTQGIQSLFDKPFKNGINGTVEGLQDFLVGLSTSALKLTSIPASVLNAITSKIGIGRPLWSINKVCDKLIDKINPQIPHRFIKK